MVSKAVLSPLGPCLPAAAVNPSIFQSPQKAESSNCVPGVLGELSNLQRLDWRDERLGGSNKC